MIFQTSATNFFHCFFLYHFSPVLYKVVNYPNTWFKRSFLARSAHQSNKIYNKIQNIWFPLPAYSVLQLPKQCLRKMWCCLTFVYVYILMCFVSFKLNLINKYIQFSSSNSVLARCKSRLISFVLAVLSCRHAKKARLTKWKYLTHYLPLTRLAL